MPGAHLFYIYTSFIVRKSAVPFGLKIGGFNIWH